MPVKGSECRVSKMVNSDACPHPTAQVVPWMEQKSVASDEAVAAAEKAERGAEHGAERAGTIRAD